jgi:glycosyltransferase involved in cell wall biosynthesis
MSDDAMNSVVLVTAWTGQPSVADLRRIAGEGLRPRKDYVEIADRLGATVIDGAYLARVAPRDVRAAVKRGLVEQAQVWAAIRQGADQVIAWGDRLGLLAGAVSRVTPWRPDLLVVSHYVTTPRRERFIRASGALRRARVMVHYSSTQLDHARTRLGVPPDRLAHLLQPVDLRFWTPDPSATDEGLVVAAGTEARDYPVLVEAMRGLDARLEIAVGSMVMATGDRGTGRVASTMAPVPVDLPANVTVRHDLSPHELRALYRRAHVVAVPLRDVDFDAGVTAITEALAMGKPLVVSRTRGQVDVITDGRDGLMVPPGDVVAMREALVRLLSRSGEAAALAAAGQELVHRRHSLDDYVDRFVGLAARR